VRQDNYILCIANILAVILLIFGLPHRQPGANLNLPLRILPLGDATTWGWQPNQENGTDGYRARLLRELVRARYHSVDFVGTQHSGFMDNNDNEGHEGHTISQLQGVMRDGLQMRPNLVLLHVGTNDLARPESMAEGWSDAPNRLASLLDEVLDVCPDAVVLVAKIIQAEKMQTRANIEAFNDAVPMVVRKKLEQGFKLAVVDHSIIGPSELVDGLHPSYAGYFHMGEIWLEAIKTISAQGLITAPIAVQYHT
jgi:lysophospholipase L1-like esterase